MGDAGLEPATSPSLLFVGSTGLEPVTSSMSTTRASQLRQPPMICARQGSNLRPFLYKRNAPPLSYVRILFHIDYFTLFFRKNQILIIK